MSDDSDTQEKVIEITDRILRKLQLPARYAGLDRVHLIVFLSEDLRLLTLAELAGLAWWVAPRVSVDQADSET